MATRLEAPTDEELAAAEAAIAARRAEQEFEQNRERMNALRPKGAAKISKFRSRAFNATQPPVSRGPIDVMPEDQPPAEAETAASILRAATARATTVAKPNKKGKFDVPEVKNAQTILKGIGTFWVEDRKKDPVKAFENVQDAVMSNIDLLLPMMSQIKQMFEFLQIGIEKPKANQTNGDGENKAERMQSLRSWLQGDDE